MANDNGKPTLTKEGMGTIFNQDKFMSVSILPHLRHRLRKPKIVRRQYCAGQSRRFFCDVFQVDAGVIVYAVVHGACTDILDRSYHRFTMVSGNEDFISFPDCGVLKGQCDRSPAGGDANMLNIEQGSNCLRLPA